MILYELLSDHNQDYETVDESSSSSEESDKETGIIGIFFKNFFLILFHDCY